MCVDLRTGAVELRVRTAPTPRVMAREVEVQDFARGSLRILETGLSRQGMVLAYEGTQRGVVDGARDRSSARGAVLRVSRDIDGARVDEPPAGPRIDYQRCRRAEHRLEGARHTEIVAAQNGREALGERDEPARAHIVHAIDGR